MKKIIATLSTGKCPIIIESGILDRAGSVLKKSGIGKKVGVVTNPTIKPLLANRVISSLKKAGFETELFLIPDGETSKSLGVAAKLFTALVERNFERNSTLIALGGGVVGDLTGFVAATFMRGINFVQIPTTLLAQVDSSIGGKVGVDLPEGKNLIGAFYQPKMVLSDPSVLSTLPEKEIKSGMAEIVKSAVIGDSGLFSILERTTSLSNPSTELLDNIIARTCKIKVSIVETDEKEQNGQRLVLNFGHTLGHALEAIKNFTGISHGDAVSIGMVFASRLSHKLGMLKERDLMCIVDLLEKIGLPTTIDASLDLNILVEKIHSDKKVANGKLRLILPQKIGKAIVIDKVPEKLMLKTLGEMQ